MWFYQKTLSFSLRVFFTMSPTAIDQEHMSTKKTLVEHL